MCFFIQSCEPLEEKQNMKKATKRESTSFFHEPCVLLASPFSPSPHFSTDRNLTVANLHVLATQINIGVLISLLGLRKSPASYFCSTLEIFLGSSTALYLQSRICHQLGCRSQPISSVVIFTPKCRAAPGPPFSRCNPPPHPTPGGVRALPGLGSDFTLEQLQKQSAISCLLGSLFPCPNTHAGWPLLPSVTLPCFAGADVGVCDLLCVTCTVPLSYLSTGCFSQIRKGAQVSWASQESTMH